MSGAQGSLLESGKPLREWVKENAKLWNAGKYKESQEFNGQILIPAEKVAEAKLSIEENARYFVNVQLFGGFVTMDIVPLEALKPLFGEFKIPEVRLGGSAPPTKEESK